MRMVTVQNINRERMEVPAEDMRNRFSVYGVIVRDDEVLLAGYQDGWLFPGGGIEKGETIEEALEREIWEETGLRAKQGDLLHVDRDFFTYPGADNHFSTILLFYTATVDDGEPSLDNVVDDHEKTHSRVAHWFSIEEALRLKFYNPVDSPALIRKAVALR